MKKYKFLVVFTLVLIILISNLNVFAAYSPATPIQTDAVLLINTDTDFVVYEKNADKKLYPASLTKIMTAILAIEHYKGKDLNEIFVTAKQSAFDDLYGTGASNADIRRDETLSMKDALYALILQSACESANVISQNVSPDTKTFVAKMNARAKELGAKNTHFVNPHGLHNPDQVTTARDVAILTKYALTLPLFAEISNTFRYEMKPTNKHASPRLVVHTNLMLDKVRGGKYYYPYVKGIKTGTTEESGKNLVTTATKDGYNYLLVQIGSPIVFPNGVKIADNISFIEAKSIYDWAFKEFKVKNIATKENILSEVKVRLAWDTDHVKLVPKADVVALVPTSIDISTIKKEITAPKTIDAPVVKGAVLGQIKFTYNNEVIATSPLVASESINRNIFLLLGSIISAILPWILSIISIVIVLIVVYIFIAIRTNKKKKK